ncbi:hypothetical protein Sango_0602400 [Sesamum angolense]|uniref:Uncharacterized protein n=1 Tax=Sesamum angolense TaxID=2727404 RepID=A0AAE1X752_9LAMI|nr:hypothetical protein Sango_0602400 [Sesamum angolense]
MAAGLPSNSRVYIRVFSNDYQRLLSDNSFAFGSYSLRKSPIEEALWIAKNILRNSRGNIFDVKMNIDGQNITASRLPPYQSYLDPATFDEMISKGSSSTAETPTPSTSNGKPVA